MALALFHDICHAHAQGGCCRNSESRARFAGQPIGEELPTAEELKALEERFLEAVDGYIAEHVAWKVAQAAAEHGRSRLSLSWPAPHADDWGAQVV